MGSAIDGSAIDTVLQDAVAYSTPRDYIRFERALSLPFITKNEAWKLYGDFESALYAAL